ncbi:MAG: hypothetical protein V7646_4463 [Pseudonocardia sp.]|jgi:hypothetical protein
MTSVSTSDDSERRVAEALRARASGAGRAGARRTAPPMPPAARGVQTALLIGLLGGIVLGIVLALLSLLTPGVLPALG